MTATKTQHNQRGFSLAEVMVATAILVIVLVGILTLYDRANRVFKTGNEAAEMQQNVRVAYDRMVADIRMAGFDYKRGGVLLPTQNPAKWQAAQSYSAGTIVTPTVPNGHTYRATTSGTSSNSEPTWCTTPSQCTCTDAGATPSMTWQENGGAVYEQPDEQIEYAGASAVTIRGNFDYAANEPGDVDHGREPNLESSQFPMVTTGNDEIVTYALVSDGNPAANTQSITMYLDLNNGACSPATTPCRRAYPGGVAERLVTINSVDLTNNNPPYTLYRFNFDNNGVLQRTPLASGIRSLNFFYFMDPAGTKPLADASGTLQPNIGGLGQYDPANIGGTANYADRLVRATIRAVRVRLVGMNSQPDQNYSDTSTANGQLTGTTTAGLPVFGTDTATVATTQKPMAQYRRLTVDTVIAPRNLGMKGMAQTFLQPPPKPTLTSICIGYCGIAVVNWNPNTNNPNATYVVSWDTNPAGSFSNAFNAGTSNTYAVDLTQQDLTKTFYFQVTATNSGGSVTSTNVLSASAANATKPNPPINFVGTGGGGSSPGAIAGHIHLTWSAPTTNASGSPSCTPSGTPPVTNYIREIQGFRIWRHSTTQNFNAPCSGDPNCTRVVDETMTGTAAPVDDGYGNYYWDDTNVVCGQTYYYRIRTVEWCAANAAYNTSGNANDALSDFTPTNGSNATPGMSGTSGTPQTPVNFQIAPDAPATPPSGLTNSSCDSVANLCQVNMSWGRVTQTTAPVRAVAIDIYRLDRRQWAWNTGTGSYQLTGVNGSLYFTGALTAPAPGSSPSAPDPSTVYYTDANLPYIDTSTGVRYHYDYVLTAMQANPATAACPSSATTAPPISYPPPCTFTGSVIVETGASAGDGLTPGSAWVMNTGDTIQVNPPVGTTFANTIMQVVDPSGNLILTNTSATTPALFTWANLTPGVTYTCTFTMTNTAVPPATACTQTLVRYIQQEPVPACSLTDMATQSTILRNTSTNFQLQLDLINNAPEPLNLTSIDFEWNPPTRITWNSIAFTVATGHTVAGPGTTKYGPPPSAPFTVTLNPLPTGFNSNDVTVPANGTRSLFLNFAKTSGSPPNITPAAITFVCVHYTRASVTQVSNFISSIAVTNGGSGYTSAPTVTITDATGIAATATATVTGGIVTAINVTNEGNGYTSPTVTLSGGGGSGATAVASTQVSKSVTSIAVANGGSGYTSAPTVTITDPTGSGATATATVSGGKVTAITVTNGGQNYTNPTVSFSGGAGTGAVATASIQAQQVPIPFFCAIVPSDQPGNPSSCR